MEPRAASCTSGRSQALGRNRSGWADSSSRIPGGQPFRARRHRGAAVVLPPEDRQLLRGDAQRHRPAAGAEALQHPPRAPPSTPAARRGSLQPPPPPRGRPRAPARPPRSRRSPRAGEPGTPPWPRRGLPRACSTRWPGRSPRRRSHPAGAAATPRGTRHTPRSAARAPPSWAPRSHPGSRTSRSSSPAATRPQPISGRSSSPVASHRNPTASRPAERSLRTSAATAAALTRVSMRAAQQAGLLAGDHHVGTGKPPGKLGIDRVPPRTVVRAERLREGGRPGHCPRGDCAGDRSRPGPRPMAAGCTAVQLSSGAKLAPATRFAVIRGRVARAAEGNATTHAWRGPHTMCVRAGHAGDSDNSRPFWRSRKNLLMLQTVGQ